MTDKLDPRAAGARRFKDKICVITGAGQGIGRATARRLGQEGGKIVIADRIDETATSTLKELHEHDVEATKVIVDLSTYKGAKDLMNEARSIFGRIDVLINNAGILRDKSFSKMTLDDFDMVVNVHLPPSPPAFPLKLCPADPPISILTAIFSSVGKTVIARVISKSEVVACKFKGPKNKFCSSVSNTFTSSSLTSSTVKFDC